MASLGFKLLLNTHVPNLRDNKMSIHLQIFIGKFHTCCKEELALNFLATYLFIKELFRTPPSPKIITLKSDDFPAIITLKDFDLRTL